MIIMKPSDRLQYMYNYKYAKFQGGFNVEGVWSGQVRVECHGPAVGCERACEKEMTEHKQRTEQQASSRTLVARQVLEWQQFQTVTELKAWKKYCKLIAYTKTLLRERD
jgi:hypothetical protein